LEPFLSKTKMEKLTKTTQSKRGTVEKAAGRRFTPREEGGLRRTKHKPEESQYFRSSLFLQNNYYPSDRGNLEGESAVLNKKTNDGPPREKHQKSEGKRKKNRKKNGKPWRSKLRVQEKRRKQGKDGNNLTASPKKGKIQRGREYRNGSTKKKRPKRRREKCDTSDSKL